MRSINDYSEYLAALKDKSSKDPAIRAEAMKALDYLQREAPDRYTLYRILNKEIEAPKEEAPKGERRVYDKEKYIREHPEINVNELRYKAKERLKKGSYGFALCFDLPTWLTEENLLKSVDQLTISDLITGNGKPVPRQTLLRRCIKIAVAERRIDETKLRNYICGVFCSYYNSKIVTLKTPSLYEPVKKMIMEKATVEELVKISDGPSFNFGELGLLIYKTEKTFSEEQLKEMESKEITRAEKEARHKAKRQAKKEARKAKKEAEKAEEKKNNQ